MFLTVPADTFVRVGGFNDPMEQQAKPAHILQ